MTETPSSRSTLDVNGLYILLSDRGGLSYLFHWGFYLHQSEKSGFIHHLVNHPGSSEWVCLTQPSEEVVASPTFLAALKVGDLEPILHQPLGERLHRIPICHSTRFHEDITCRVWLKEALFALDDEGYIKLVKSVGDIEEEAKHLATRNKSLGRRTIALSGGSIA
ncbi:hypothetical protein ASPZODRAFT_1288721 [Penicilliopsis zonata CBS 506.65]|uniref:Uncharacterized protein n=1 Tax=Penicilliopsis zonata CBS 506.65 TaxID=1073090 RepID=A0A1L9S6A4_9EURO|nr:hypothetical protein ASPZODRAFT_1288721 [Penicilliopsis zonata CBS 506.65]OJJ42687.1 hypothetical protein ASPZODRAFT_1288721 [Penicilliopsis zonata CBS 506.65]